MQSRPASSKGPLVLFFTRYVALGTWEERGILGREVALYQEMAARGREVAFVTYGGAADLEYAPRLDGISVLPNERELPPRVYSQLVPLLHRRAIARAQVLKTNQVYGGIAALRAARLYRRPLVARCGFLWTEVSDAEDGAGSLRARFVENRERRLLRGADVVTVTTPRLGDRVHERHGVPRNRIVVIPNFVDTRRFAPAAEAPEPRSLVFVGRLSPEKNLEALLEALAGLDGTSLTVVGDGPLRADLEAHADRLGIDAQFVGPVAHERLPEILGRAEAFVLPSRYEGHPKAAIEAMACGLPLIGTDVPGIRDLVHDGETGVLCGTSASEIREAVERVLGDPGLRERLGRGARAAVEPLSLERTVDLEEEIIERAVRARAAA
jgi:glycosyltransferase involved in cell wall biosynthesis